MTRTGSSSGSIIQACQSSGRVERMMIDATNQMSAFLTDVERERTLALAQRDWRLWDRVPPSPRCTAMTSEVRDPVCCSMHSSSRRGLLYLYTFVFTHLRVVRRHAHRPRSNDGGVFIRRGSRDIDAGFVHRRRTDAAAAASLIVDTSGAPRHHGGCSPSVQLARSLRRAAPAGDGGLDGVVARGTAAPLGSTRVGGGFVV